MQQLTGDYIRNMRETLALLPPQFASLLGVSLSTLYRWESANQTPNQIDPMQVQLLALLQLELDHRLETDARKELGSSLATALLTGGSLYALYKLLSLTFAANCRAQSTTKTGERP